MSLDRMRAALRRWLWRREAVALLPAALLMLHLGLGEPALWGATLVFPALLVALMPGPAARVRVTDGVTGLQLRADLTGALDAAFAEGPRIGRTPVAFAVGIDDFDDIATRLGQHLTEEVERRTAQRIAATLRQGDVVARLGPGRFGVAFGPAGRADLETAMGVATRLQVAVRAPIPAPGASVHLTCSVGFCLGARAPRPSGDAALAAAVEALEEAAAGGAAAIRSFAGPRPRGIGVGAAASEIIAALEGGQIRPWFQPQVATRTGRISGMEALARWEHPRRGVLPPRDFLPALTEAGLLARLGEAMLAQGLTAMAQWDSAGLSVPTLGLNFASEELRDPGLPDRLSRELRRFALAPGRLSVEILETVVVDAGDDSIARTVAALAALGCNIDLDDFGTGNASLAALRRFSVRRIKIDRSFVINVDQDRDQQRMVAAILGLAERLGLETLAEGVERAGEQARLGDLGCGHVQGYGIARPMPFADTRAWLERHAQALAAPAGAARRAG